MFQLGRHGPEDPVLSNEDLREIYTPSYMLYCLRSVGLSQQNSIDVHVYILLMDILFDIPISLYILRRGDGVATTLQPHITAGTDEQNDKRIRRILFVSDDYDLDSFYSPILSSTVLLFSDLYSMIKKLEMTEIVERMDK